MKVFLNARIILPDGMIQRGFLTEENGIITALGRMEDAAPINGEALDCDGLYLSPGFIDLHTHGGGGYDYMDGKQEDFLGAARAHLAHGATSLLPTTMACSDEELYDVIDAFRQAFTVKEKMPHLLGLHLEGPYFALEQRGAQDAKYIRSPEPSHYMGIIDYAQGAIKRWSLAPELPGAIEMADRLAGSGIMLSAAHTSANCAQMKSAFDHGIKHLTHFYSAMSTIYRDRGFRVLGAVESGYLIDGLKLELIADGVHLPPELLRLILKCKDHGDISLCTDSMRGAGMPDGPSILGSKSKGQAVLVENGIAVMPDRSCFAGSVATTDRLVRVMVYQAGLPLWEAVNMVSLHPARLIGCDKEKGSLEVSKHADIILFDEDISIRSVYVAGKKIIF